MCLRVASEVTLLEIPPCQIPMCGVAYSCSYVLLVQGKSENPQRSATARATVQKFHAYERLESPGYENWVRTKYSGFTVVCIPIAGLASATSFSHSNAILVLILASVRNHGKHIENVWGFDEPNNFSFSFACFLVKSNLHTRLAFIFAFSIEQILRFVLLSITTELFKGENRQICRGENVADSPHVE